jgi:predicted transcriptional regulator
MPPSSRRQTGRRRLYKVVVNKDGVKMEPADDLKGLGNYATVDKVKAAVRREGRLHFHRPGR